jgi:transposase
VLDAVWLCKLAERKCCGPVSCRRGRSGSYGIRPATVPNLVCARTVEKNRVEKLLEDACIKVSVGGLARLRHGL